MKSKRANRNSKKGNRNNKRKGGSNYFEQNKRAADKDNKQNNNEGKRIPKKRIVLKSQNQDLPPIPNDNIRELEEKGIRLNKYVSNAGVCSRRKAADLIKQGLVTVNGKVILEMGHKVQAGDVVKYNGQILSIEQKAYILLNKPKNMITTTSDPRGRPTVMDLVAKAANSRLYPVGRLDRNTTGLILLTNDGELAQNLSHPSKMVRKLYHVTLDKAISKRHFESIINGITLEDGPIQVDSMDYVAKAGSKNELGVMIHSGRNRIVRRIFEHFGYEVRKLDRVIFAGLTKKDLPRGKWRKLSKEEIIFLKHYKIS